VGDSCQNKNLNEENHIDSELWRNPSTENYWKSKRNIAITKISDQKCFYYNLMLLYSLLLEKFCHSSFLYDNLKIIQSY